MEDRKILSKRVNETTRDNGGTTNVRTRDEGAMFSGTCAEKISILPKDRQEDLVIFLNIGQFQSSFARNSNEHSFFVNNF